jgi:beta-glucosidase
VTNTGHRAGSQTVQIYLGPASRVSVDQPTKALAGYTKVHLRLGQSKRVKIRIGNRSLQHWDTTADRWVTSTGTRTLWAGSSAADLPLRTDIRVR